LKESTLKGYNEAIVVIYRRLLLETRAKPYECGVVISFSGNNSRI